MNIELFRLFISVLLFTCLVVYVNVRANTEWLRLITLVLMLWNMIVMLLTLMLAYHYLPNY